MMTEKPRSLNICGKGWNLIILVVFFIFPTAIQKQKAEKGKNEKT